MKLLLVDDEPGIREGLAAFLRRKGHEVVTAGDCARAVDRLRDGDLDLVLTDWHLPDGVAETFLSDCACPVVAMSGHPEEIADHPGLREVLTKPVPLAQLVDLVASYESAPASADGAELPLDVARLVATATTLLGDATVIEDDGTFVVVRAALAAQHSSRHGGGVTDAPISSLLLGDLRALGGDLRVLAPAGIATIELRWLRDGRPDAGIPLANPCSSWPDVAELAIDFTPAVGSPALTEAAFGVCIDRAEAARQHGRTVHFLNVPNSLLSWATGQGKSREMPMRAPVGPRLPEVLADLWS